MAHVDALCGVAAFGPVSRFLCRSSIDDEEDLGLDFVTEEHSEISWSIIRNHICGSH